jgi:hypothetical protein
MSRAGLFVLLVVFAVPAVAQTSVVTSFDHNGRISWTATTTNVDHYRVEWASSLTGQWFYSWTGLDNIAPSNGEIATNVPMFYRIVAVLPPPPQGDRFDNPFLISSGTVTGNSSVAFANDYFATNCGFATMGPDIVYQFTLPAGQRLTATVSPAAEYDTAIYLVTFPGTNYDSGNAVFLTGANTGGTGATETVSWDNPSGSPLNVFIVVDGPSGSDAGAFTLATATTVDPIGETCATAVPILTGVLLAQSTVGYANDYNASSCGASSLGPDRVYRTTIPAGMKLTATVAPVEFDTVIYLLASPYSGGIPGPSSCLAIANLAGTGGSETAIYTNPLPLTVDVFIVVDGAGASDAGIFSLTTTIGH